MTVTVVAEHDPEKVVPLRFAPDPPAPSPPAPPVADRAAERQAVTIHAVGVLTALAEVLSIRLALTLAVVASALLAFFAETRETPLAVVAAAMFTLLGLVPLAILAYRKG